MQTTAIRLGAHQVPPELRRFFKPVLCGQCYICQMVRVFGLVREALAEHGTCWLNIGDSYSHAPGKRKPTDAYGAKQKTNGYESTTGSASAPDIDPGNLCLIPQRLTIALQDDGWLVRSVVVWHKPAPMPASIAGWRWMRCRVKVKGCGASPSRRQCAGMVDESTSRGRNPDSSRNPDLQAQWSDCPGCKKCNPHGGYVLRRGSWRPTSSWEPILILAKTDRYFCDGEAVKTPPAAATVSRDQYTRVLDDPDEQFAVKHDHETICDGANLRDVWTIAAEPLRCAHYAAFPSELVQRCLRAGTSAKGYCAACGKPLCRVIERKPGEVEADQRPKQTAGMNSGTSTLSLSGNGSKEWAERGTSTKTIGWRPSCSCPEAPPRPALVCDPFCGSGRTGLNAQRLGLDFVGCELNPDYVEMAARLLFEDSPLFAQTEATTP